MHATIAKETMLSSIQEKLAACMQCGTCTGSCPNAFSMDLTPRHLWRLVLSGLTEEVFRSRTFFLCSQCFRCTLRCPRGLPLTEAMSDLKNLACQSGWFERSESVVFYRHFLSSVRKHGRLNELELMSGFFMAMGNPVLPFRFASLGIRLIRKGKLSFVPSAKHRKDLSALFRKVDEMENRS
ncbi:4Fe-4S dicluster domain-containing protein [Desulfatirhabdium butyrativorans]|uniref:4Fe-4S dicluster domain-containing protein n=1 Tax=Desulfatirhabdium butyrativorans TaxID=340467 RepID=UPI0004200CFF|nr:4Fe-4S dicluster domain-containing protein [Desulfatirhabdium butyrativorans]